MIQNLNLVTAEKLNIPTACIEIDTDEGRKPKVKFMKNEIEWYTLDKDNQGEPVLIKDEVKNDDDSDRVLDLIIFSADVWANPNYRGKLPSIPLLDENFDYQIKFRVSEHPSLVNFLERLDENMSEGKQVQLVIYEYIKTVLAQKLRTLPVQ